MVPHLTSLARQVEGRVQSRFKDAGKGSRRAAWPRGQLGYRRCKRRTHPGAFRGQPCPIRLTTSDATFHRMVHSLLYLTALLCSHPLDRRYGPPKHPILRKVISEGKGHFSAKRIEFYPYKIKTYRMSKIKPHLPSSEPTHAIHISKAAPVSELLTRVSEKWGNVVPARFWHAQVNFLEQDPIDGIFYTSSRIESDSTQPFATTEENKKKRLDEAGLEDGDAIIMETKHGEEWTIDLESTTLGHRINRQKAQEPKVAVFTEEQMAKYRNHRAIKPDIGSTYYPSSAGYGSTAYTTPVTTPSFNRTLVLNGRSSVASSSRTVAPGTVGLNNLCVDNVVDLCTSLTSSIGAILAS
jgi:hypothetical protein